MKNQNTKLTAEQRIAYQARVAALRAEANALSKVLKEEDATQKVEETPVVVVETTDEVAEVTEEVTETPVEEAEVTEEVTETPVEEAEVTEEVTETPVEEAEVTEEVTETPAEEEEVTKEVTETPAEEEEVTKEVTETPAEEEEVTEEVTETPAEEEEVTEEVTETPAEEAEVTKEVTETSDKEENASKFQNRGWIFVIVIAAVVALLIAMISKPDKQVEPDTDEGTTPPVVDTNPGKPDELPGTDATPVVPEFDMDAFVTSVENIAKTLTADEDIASNTDLFVEKIGEDKLKELVGKYGELPVQKAIAEFLAFVPEIKMHQYISNNGLDYNPDATNDWLDMLDEASDAYKEATGKNPEGAFMSLEGYDTYKSNREAMKALIIESGDTALLTWYEAKTTGYDVMLQQQSDTKVADEYKEEVKLELVNNVNGSVKLLELQLEQNVNGTNSDTLDYTEVYDEFIKNNYMYVVAN